MVWDHVEGSFYLAGAAENEPFNQTLNECIRGEIRREAQSTLPHLSEFTLYCDPRIWQGQIDLLLRETEPMSHRRLRLTLAQLQVDWRSRVPAGYAMRRIDEAILRSGLKNVEVMREWLLGTWRSDADFLGSDIGFCLLHGEEIAGWCASEFTCRPTPGSGKACEVGIYTAEAHRRHGVATLTAAATIEACLGTGIERIGWHCWERNVASAATARRVGFKLSAEYVVYNACFNRFDNLLLQAHYHAQVGRLQEALDAWERAFVMWEARHAEALSAPHVQAFPETIPWCYYAAGRSWARLGDSEAAFRNLNKAADNGWRDAERLAGDEALASLHRSREWAPLLSRISGG
jgi:RimJ/RimL family protein N-acetyltransferase